MRLPQLLNSKIFLIFSGLSGASAILLGAWSSHALSGQEKNWVDIALRYQVIHAIALFILGVWLQLNDQNTHKISRFVFLTGYLWIIGMLLFAGSLLLLALTNITIFGSFTPIGGITMTMGWLSLIVTAIKLK